MEDMSLFSMIVYGVFGLFALVVFFSSWFTVEQQTTAVIERFGKFVRIATAGLNIKLPIIEQIAGRPNLRVQQLDVKVETKTQDNVFVHVVVSVQFFVLKEKVYDAFYRLTNPTKQITSFVFDVVRSSVPKIKLDDVFEKKDDIGDAVKKELTEVMDDYGYNIVKALVTDIDPDPKVKESMNAINAAQRLRAAAQEQGEAEKVILVKKAEAESESKILQGKGIAGQRREIIAGLRDSVEQFKESVQGATSQDVMQLVLLNQYFDVLKDIGASNRSTTILLPHSPGVVKELGEQIRDSFIVAEQVKGNGLDKYSKVASVS